MKKILLSFLLFFTIFLSIFLILNSEEYRTHVRKKLKEYHPDLGNCSKTDHYWWQLTMRAKSILAKRRKMLRWRIDNNRPLKDNDMEPRDICQLIVEPIYLLPSSRNSFDMAMIISMLERAVRAAELIGGSV